mmetsp:Transcript_33156/g.72283  ORF Transcript_33156/g.72283 Transcript_33156/m.72283 type:complete len:328 (+) Transcript_33156:98-1081(+)
MRGPSQGEASPKTPKDEAGGVRSDNAPCRAILDARDLYSVIGVPRNADIASIKAEFRRRAREVHPDKNASPLADEAFKRLQKSYEVLSDPSARRRYDWVGEETHRSAPTPPRAGPCYKSSDSAEDPLHTLIKVLFPLLMAWLISMLLGFGFVNSSGGHAGPFNNGWKHRNGHEAGPRQPEGFSVVHLTAQNADTACGAAAKGMCVVLLRKPGSILGEREANLLSSLHDEARRDIRNSRGQSLSFTWCTVEAAASWRELLPSGATLPWVVVLKPSRLGPRVVSLSVPPNGAKVKRRLSDGVPKLLQSIALGEANFKQVKGTVSSLFRR